MTRYHDVRQLTTSELERIQRELRANLCLISPHSPMHVPIEARMRAVNAELAARTVADQGTYQPAGKTGRGDDDG
jgi:hypothetical protein